MHRRGSTLAEVLVVVGLSGVIAGLGISALTVIVKAERQSRIGMDQRLQFARLTRQFRRDAHQAIHCKSSADGASLRFQLSPSQAIEYAQSPQGVRRFVSENLEVTHRDLFLLSDVTVRFSSEESRDSQGGHRLATAYLSHLGDAHRPAWERSVEAALLQGEAP